MYMGHFLGFLVGLYMIGVGGFHIGLAFGVDNEALLSNVYTLKKLIKKH